MKCKRRHVVETRDCPFRIRLRGLVWKQTSRPFCCCIWAFGSLCHREIVLLRMHFLLHCRVYTIPETNVKANANLVSSMERQSRAETILWEIMNSITHPETVPLGGCFLVGFTSGLIQGWNTELDLGFEFKTCRQ